MSHDLNIDQQICKETTCYNVEHQLPDGSWINLDRERFEAPEIIFNPYKMGLETDGVGEMILDSCFHCPTDTRRTLYSKILTSGGTSMLAGFSTRLENEITKLWLAQDQAKRKKLPFKIKIKDPPRRKYSVFMGAGVIAQHFN